MTQQAEPFHRTATHYRHTETLAGEYYTSPEILAEEQERLFATQWNCVGRASRLAEPGSYFLCSIAGESLIVLRDRGGELHAFFNVCRHRGTRLCSEVSGRFSGSIQCPYHAWTYSTDGRLIGAPHMQEVDGFAKQDYPLHAASVAEWEGFVFVNIADDAVPFTQAWTPMLGRLARYDLAGLWVGHRVSYDVAANWKLVFENYSECLHCPMIHPELSVVLPYQSGANDLIEGSFLGGYMEITEPNESATLSGRACGRLVNPQLSAEDRRRAFYYSLKPNLLLSIHPDYVNYYMVTPVTPERTTVESEWLFHPDNQGDPAFNPEDAIGFWDVTNRQDWAIVARSQLGIGSRKYRPGVYSARESIPAAWDRAYLQMMGRS
jgi:phenylpropionate dioxygenase-like ring-hydroxylating dioxygenase large terminal subunit